jgi:flagellar biosynthesis/type III secretory pathway protein FliH
VSPSRLLEAPLARRFVPPEVEGVEDAVRAGYARGLERGLKDAQAEAGRQQRAAAGRLAGSLASLHALERQVLGEVRAEVTELALAIASRIVRERIASGDPLAVRIAEEVFTRTGPGLRRRIRLNPEDLAAVTAAAATLAEPGGVELVADPRIERGGLLVESTEEAIDACITTAIDLYRDALEDPA